VAVVLRVWAVEGKRRGALRALGITGINGTRSAARCVSGCTGAQRVT
jgi:hypothetical protein